MIGQERRLARLETHRGPDMTPWDEIVIHEGDDEADLIRERFGDRNVNLVVWRIVSPKPRSGVAADGTLHVPAS